MSVKKINQTEKHDAGGTIDPLAVAFVTHQVRELLRFHQSMGIETYPACEELAGFLNKNASHPPPPRPQLGRTRPSRPIQSPVSVQAPPAPVPDFQPSAASLQAIHQEITDCRACVLAEHRQGQVFGSKLKQLRLMVVGDWSRQVESFAEDSLFGSEEDVMLWRMMEAIGLSRNDVYVSNVIKCCPAAGTPDPDCAAHCFGHLSREIAALKPGLIMAMGEMAAAQLLGVSAPLVRLRGRFHQYRYPDSAPARIMPTFHPRFLMANPEMKKMVWQDLQMVQRQLAV